MLAVKFLEIYNYLIIGTDFQLLLSLEGVGEIGFACKRNKAMLTKIKLKFQNKNCFA